MHVLHWVAANWHDILVMIVLIAACITGIQQWIKRNGPIFKSMSAQEKIAYITRLLTNLIPIAFVLVTDAEITYGDDGTNALKRSYVIDELYQRIPDEYKKYVTEQNLDDIINKVLPEAKKLWVESSFLAKTVGGEIPYADRG